MASDIFAKIGDIKGESLDDNHKDEIDVMSYSWGVTQAGSIVGGGGGGEGKAQFNDFNFTTNVSKASPFLFLACASGQHIKEAKLVGRKAGKAQQEYLTWTFSDILVSSYQTSGSEGDDAVIDSVSVNFSKAVVSYKAQKADGSLDTAVTAGWDAKTNKKL